MPAVLTGMFLAVARVAGEAAPLLFTAFGSNDWPGSPIKPVGSLPQLMFDYAAPAVRGTGAAGVGGGAWCWWCMILGIRLLTERLHRAGVTAGREVA